MNGEVLAALHPFLVAWALALGAVLGSFLNVVVARVPAGLSLVRPGSRCPRCLAPIAWYDNVPVLSWAFLRGRCRRCAGRIALRYPLVELAGAAAALVAFERHGLSGAAGAELVYVLALVALALIDLDTWLLPNALTWPLLAAGIAAGWAGAGQVAGPWPALAGAGVGFAAFAAVAAVGQLVFRKEALGFGDVWLLAALGAWNGPTALLPIVLFASLQGTVVGLALIALGKAQPGPPPAPPTPVPPAPGDGTAEPPGAPAPDALPPEAAPAEEAWVPPRHAVPFGPFLVIGALEWLYLGPALTQLVPALRVLR